MSILFNTSLSRLPIPETAHVEARRTNQNLENTGIALQQYLNQVCVSTIIPWIAEASGQSTRLVQGTPASWERVSGSAIQVGDIRFVIIPSEAMDREEFAVPQEWIDAPNWVGDYYLAVEVDPDEQWIEPWGYATHAMLKTQSQYDPIARTYNLESDRIISDFSVLWIMLNRSEPTRTELPAIPAIPSEQAQQWIRQLSSTSVSLHRWSLPMGQWCALVNNASWFQQLCTLRPASAQETSTRPPVDLSAWLHGAITAGWAAIETLFPSEPNWAINVRSASSPSANAQRYATSISLGDSVPEVVLAVALQIEAGDRRSIAVQILPGVGENYLPASLRLTMYSMSGDDVQSVTADAQTRLMQLRPFRCAPGTEFRIQVATETTIIDEVFIA